MPGVTFQGNGLTCESAFCVNVNMAIIFKPSMGCKGDNADFFLPISSFIGVTGCSDMVLFFFFFLVFLGEWLIFGPIPRPLDVYVLNAYGSFSILFDSV